MATKYIVAARSNENGGITGGKKGDQTGKEVMVQTLSSSGSWTYILRPPSGTSEMVKQAYAAAANDLIGYSQGTERTTLYTLAKAVSWNIAKVSTACSCDCSALVAVLCNCGGFPVSKDMWTGDEISLLTAKGFAKKSYSELSLVAGDVLWRDGHTGIYVGTSDTYTSPDITVNEVDYGTNAVYRLYNQWSGDHMFTVSRNEELTLQGLGWTLEGKAWTAASSGVTVNRLYNSYGGHHLWTTSDTEKNSCVKNGWTSEGLAFYSGGDLPVFRLYNPYSGFHHYTTSTNERDTLVSLGWKNEGTAFYGA